MSTDTLRAALEAALDDIDEPTWYGYYNPNTFGHGVAAARAAVLAALASSPQQAAEPRWLIARETVINDIPGQRPSLGYTVFREPFTTFGYFPEASDAITELGLPLGWVAMKVNQEPWASLFPAGQVVDLVGAPSEITIDFAQIGRAGPFPVINGTVSLPDVTMRDLAHILKPTVEALATQTATKAEPAAWQRLRDGEWVCVEAEDLEAWKGGGSTLRPLFAARDAQTPPPIPDRRGKRCSTALLHSGLAAPRTCEACGLGPCRFHSVASDKTTGEPK